MINYQILDKKRLEVFRKLKEFKKFGYLAGGTALALQISHRLSYDFDFFCYQNISVSLVQKTRKIFKISEVLVNNLDEFTFVAKNNIKITFLFYPFKLLGSLVKTDDGPDLLSVQNIAVSKAHTIGRRAEYKDYVDLYCLLKNEIDLDNLIAKSKRVFGGLFSEKLFLSQLIYFEDIQKQEINFIREPTGSKVIKNFFETLIRQYNQSIL